MKFEQHLGLDEAQRILRTEAADLALLVGNGINLATRGNTGIAWDELMARLMTAAAAASPQPVKTEKRLKRLLRRGANGQTPASLPEVFDIIEATRTIKPQTPGHASEAFDLQSAIAHMLVEMKPGSAHRALVKWAVERDVPLLTTNYDHCFQDASESIRLKPLRFGDSKPLSDFYPWDRYYGPRRIDDPANHFAIWHIHGDRDMKRSIRAGLDQYMGMVERLRRLKRSIARDALQSATETSDVDATYVRAPWMRPFMGRKLWIQGLGAGAGEVSIRWLLVQRFRYWRRYRPEHRLASGWYVHGPTDEIPVLEPERRIFLESVGLRVIEIPKATDFYVGLFSAATAPVEKRTVRLRLKRHSQ